MKKPAAPSPARSVRGISATTVPARPRSAAWALGITALGWALFAAPAIALGVVAYLLLATATSEADPAGMIWQGLLCGALLLCLIASPVLLGLAVMTRRRGLMVAAVLTLTLSLLTVAYIAFLYFVPV